MSGSVDFAVFGTGGHGREIAALAQRVHGRDARLRFVVDRGEMPAAVNGIPVLALEAFVAEHADVPIVVAVGDSALRRGVVERLTAHGLHCTGLVHPGVELSPHVRLGACVVLFAGVLLTVNTVIGAHCHVNLGCSISHDVDMGEFCTLSPGTRIAGHVRVGAGTFFGTGANVINGRPGAPLKIGVNAVIGAGACVIRPVPDGARVGGVPAAPLRS